MCSENMQQIYRRIPMPKCDFNKVAKQRYQNHFSAWMFSCKFVAYFQDIFSLEHLWKSPSVKKWEFECVCLFHLAHFTLLVTQNMKFSIKDFFSKSDQIRSFLRIWSHLRKNSLMKNFIFCAVADRFVKIGTFSVFRGYRKRPLA